MNARQVLVCAALSGLVILPFGCGKQEAGQAQDRQEKVAIAGAKASPKREAVAADKLQNRAGVIYIVNGQEPFSGLAQNFFGNGQMQWEAEIENGKVSKLKRWHENGVLELSCRLAPGRLSDISTRAFDLLQKNHERLDGEFSAFYDNGQKYLNATFARGQPSGVLTVWRKDENVWIKTAFTNGALALSEFYNESVQLTGKAGFRGADFQAAFYNIDSLIISPIKELHGELVLYHPNGQMALQRTYENGKIVGESREWLPDGTEIKTMVVESLGLTMVLVKAGSFQMGSVSGGSDNERPVRTVLLNRDFWMGKTEVTQRQWRSLVGDNPSHFKGDDLPVENVSWDRCVEFCQKLTDRERTAGNLPDGYAYRLPTEAEWEYAARGGAQGDNTPYAGSDNLDSVAWHGGNSDDETQRVGTKAANKLGLHDMSGNVWEWVHDWYEDSYNGLATTDPTGPANGSYRVIRGGGWSRDAYVNGYRVATRRAGFPYPANFSPVTFQLIEDPDFAFYVGFRLCLAPTSSPTHTVTPSDDKSPETEAKVDDMLTIMIGKEGWVLNGRPYIGRSGLDAMDKQISKVVSFSPNIGVKIIQTPNSPLSLLDDVQKILDRAGITNFSVRQTDE